MCFLICNGSNVELINYRANRCRRMKKMEGCVLVIDEVPPRHVVGTIGAVVIVLITVKASNYSLSLLLYAIRFTGRHLIFVQVLP